MINQSQARGDLVNEIITEYADMVLRIAYIHTKNHASAEDVFQETFIQLFRSSVVFDNEEHVRAWLIRVTTNISINLLNSAWHKKTVKLPDNLQCEEKKQNSEVVEAVKSLPPKYRTVIHLYYFEDMPIAEIATALTIKENTIKSQLLRARKLLKKKLNGGFDDE